MKQGLAALFGVVLLCSVGFLAGIHLNRPAKGVSAAFVAGQAVRDMAHAAGVKILGDRVWSVRTKDGVTTVIVRVRYQYVPSFMGVPIGAPQVQVVSIPVRLVKSSYSVLP